MSCQKRCNRQHQSGMTCGEVLSLYCFFDFFRLTKNMAGRISIPCLNGKYIFPTHFDFLTYLKTGDFTCLLLLLFIIIFYVESCLQARVGATKTSCRELNADSKEDTMMHAHNCDNHPKILLQWSLLYKVA